MMEQEVKKFPCEEGCYKVEDLQRILSVSRPTVYEILKTREFAWKVFGNKYRIPKATFNEWLLKNQA